MEYKRKAHAVYSITYHIVFVTKYRKPVISDEIGDYMKEIVSDICRQNEGELISCESDVDHLHLLISLPPQKSPSEVIRILKTQTSRKVHSNERYDRYVKQFLFGNISLWNPSYFVATAGGAPLEKIKQYIDSQRTDDHKRKYEKTGRYKK